MSVVDAILEDIKRLTPAEQDEVRDAIEAMVNADRATASADPAAAAGESGESADGKRAQVRQLLRLREWQEASERALQREVGCDETVVTSERRRAIYEGWHPPTPGYPPPSGRKVPAAFRYSRYALARPNVLWTPDGGTVRVTPDEETRLLSAGSDGLTAGCEMLHNTDDEHSP